MSARRIAPVLAVVLVAGVYFFVDVRQRARIDRGRTERESRRLHRTDFTVYQYAARHLKQGKDPYQAVNPRGYRYVYPPLLAVALMPIADWAPPDAALVFFVLSVVALLWSLWALAHEPLGSRGMRLGRRATLLAALVCLGFVHQSFQRGQVTLLLLGLHVGALVAAYRGRFTVSGLLLGIGGALRLTPLLAAACVGVGLLLGARAHGIGRPARFGSGVLVGQGRRQSCARGYGHRARRRAWGNSCQPRLDDIRRRHRHVLEDVARSSW